jgi:hypothetical protein
MRALMASTLCVSCMLLAANSRAEISAESFHQLIKNENSKIKDLSLIYEGDFRWVGPLGILRGAPEDFGRRFQGIFLYRSDGAELLDVYTKVYRESAMVLRFKKSIIKGTYTSSQMVSDLAMEEYSSQPGSSSILGGPDSPHLLIYYWFFSGIENIVDWGYEFLGWEAIEGSKCLKAKLLWMPNQEEYHHIFWFDLEHGCNPVKIENYKGPNLIARVDQIQLQGFLNPAGKTVWLPVKGRLEGFRWENKQYSEPVMRTEISVLNRSVLLDQGLGDAAFKIGTTSTTHSTRQLSQKVSALSLRQAYQDAVKKTPAHSDVTGTSENLQSLLREADAQASLLEAPAPSRSTWNGTTVWQSVLTVLGISCIGFAFIWTMKHR